MPWQLFSTARADSRTAELSVSRLADDMLVISGAGGNVLAARDSQGIVLVDGGAAQYSRQLLERVSTELSASRVHTLFNTHWHPEQTGSNERLGREGATIVAHENTRLWLSTQSPLPGSEELFGPLPPVARPNETLYDTGTRPFGAERIDYGYLLQAHTDGDIYVHFPERNVLVAGGVVSGAGWPVIDWRTGGWIGGMVNGLSKLIELSDAQTRIVPATGPVLTRADLEERHAILAPLFAELRKMLTSGLGPLEAVEAGPLREYEAKYGDASTFVKTAFESLWGHLSPDA
ncbi:MAG: hypothetical protein DIU71_11210 [Proteobacteria bacterium]|nr:MAG: hypothetical protein DIU71_11210 [Pseudomonadota bacterium]